MKKLIFPAFIALSLFLTSCDKEPEEGTLTLSISNLMELASDEQYEGWIIVDGVPVSTGSFTVDAMGALSQTTFTATMEDLDMASDFVLSIEPSPDNSPSPFVFKPLVGMAPTPALDHTTYDMASNVSGFPAGTVSR